MAEPKKRELETGLIGRVARAIAETTGTIRTNVQDANAKGDTARAAGNVVSGLVRYPLAVSDALEKPAEDVVAKIPAFLGGLVGSKGGSAVRVMPQAAAAPAEVPAADPVRQAITQGQRSPDQFITPQDRLGAYIDSVLTKGATIREATALGNLLPNTSTAAGMRGKAPSAKDVVLGGAADISGALYQKELEAAKASAATPEEYAERFQKATTAFFQRNAGLVSSTQPSLADQLKELEQ